MQFDLLTNMSDPQPDGYRSRAAPGGIRPLRRDRAGCRLTSLKREPWVRPYSLPPDTLVSKGGGPRSGGRSRRQAYQHFGQLILDSPSHFVTAPSERRPLVRGKTETAYSSLLINKNRLKDSFGESLRRTKTCPRYHSNCAENAPLRLS